MNFGNACALILGEVPDATVVTHRLATLGMRTAILDQSL